MFLRGGVASAGSAAHSRAAWSLAMPPRSTTQNRQFRDLVIYVPEEEVRRRGVGLLQQRVGKSGCGAGRGAGDDVVF